jgi:hypothetical protein
MATAPDQTATGRNDRERLTVLGSARSLAELVELTGASTERDAYVRAKREWETVCSRLPVTRETASGFPGARVTIDGCDFWVHGITHAGTPEERAFVREHVDTFLDRGAAVYCEQGIRPLYLSDVAGACAMDDYRWALGQHPDIDRATLDAELPFASMFAGLGVDVTALTARVRDKVFSLIDQGGDLYGKQMKQRLGSLASAVLTDQADLATGTDFESYRLRNRAATDPTALADLQAYYTRQFLPQPVEREWLRQHDPDLERVTHARNERMAEYAVYHADGESEVHLLVGAAHQPGVSYYLEEFRNGHRQLERFEHWE